MTKKEKLEMLKEWLRENNILFRENHFSKTTGQVLDIKVLKSRIAVHVSDDNDSEFYQAVFKIYTPFFIRENETMDFIIEKMQNCILDKMMRAQRKFEKEQRKKDQDGNGSSGQ